MSVENSKKLATMIRGLIDSAPELLLFASAYEAGLEEATAMTLTASPIVLGAVGGLAISLAGLEDDVPLTDLGLHLIRGCVLKTSLAREETASIPKEQLQ